MLGAMIGDMYGSIYEWNNVKDKRLAYFTAYSYPTDDSIMSLAIGAALMEYRPDRPGAFYDACVDQMNRYGHRFPDAGYGGRFKAWLRSENKRPYNSYGNGSAMRVSPVGWRADSLEEALTLAKITAMPTHDHPEGIKGAQAVAAGIYLLKMGSTKREVKEYIEDTFGYDLSRTLDDIRPEYTFQVSCQRSVPEAIIAFLEAEDYVDAVKGAISLGGDSDTIACIAGALAEVIYPIPDDLVKGAAENLRDLRKFRYSDFAFYATFVAGRKKYRDNFVFSNNRE